MRKLLHAWRFRRAVRKKMKKYPNLQITQYWNENADHLTKPWGPGQEDQWWAVTDDGT